MSNSLWRHGLKHTKLPCPSVSSRICLNWCPLSQWCYLTISSSFVPFSSCSQSLPASGSFPMSQLFASGGQSIGASASASVLAMNIQGQRCPVVKYLFFNKMGVSQKIFIAQKCSTYFFSKKKKVFQICWTFLCQQMAMHTMLLLRDFQKQEKTLDLAFQGKFLY